MSNTAPSHSKKLFRLWAAPLLIGAAFFGAKSIDSGLVQHALLGAGMLFGGVFSLRHNLSDLSPSALDPKQIGYGWVAMLLASVISVLSAAVVAFAA